MPALGHLRNDPFMSPFDIIKDKKQFFMGEYPLSMKHSYLH